MAIKQLSVFIENKKGSMAEALKTLSDAKINIRALSVADTQEFGILRLIVSGTEKAKDLLADSTLVTVTDVIAVRMNDTQGALYTILKVLEGENIDVDYSYAFTAPHNEGAYVVFRVGDIEASEHVLRKYGFELLADEQI